MTSPRIVLGDRLESLRVARTPINTNRSDNVIPSSIFVSSLMDNKTNIALAQHSRIPSPDELLIKQRGRRFTITSWTREQSAARKNTIRSPLKTTPTKMPLTTNMILRSSPRKRLNMGRDLLDPNKLCDTNLNSPTKINTEQQEYAEAPLVKRLRLCEDEKPIAQLSEEIPLATILQGFTQKQLIELIVDKLVADNTKMEAELRNQLPYPDIEAMEKDLLHVKRMIFKSLPTSRLCSKTDNSAYKRASLHLDEFKRLVIQHTNQLHDSAHWDALLDYVIMAWPCIKATPKWDHNTNNVTRRQCFKLLICSCMAAVKCGGLRLCTTRLHILERSLQDWSQDYEGVLSCINTVKETLSNRRTGL